MLSQEIEQKYLIEQISELSKDIEAIKTDLATVGTFVSIKNLQLEKKQNLKISLEKRLEQLKNNNHSLARYMDNESVLNNDKQFATNERQKITNNSQIDAYNEQLNNTDSKFKKIDLLIQRKKLEVYNGILTRKNVTIERRQRMYIGLTRRIDALKNSPQNLKVSVNNLRLQKVQAKYENRVNRTFELEEYQKQVAAEGHKIRSKVLGKVVTYSNYSDDKVRLKYQKLLETKKGLIKIESARQFYDNYYFSLNEHKVLEGEQLKHHDLIVDNSSEQLVTGVDGNIYLQHANGGVELVSPEMLAEVAEKYGFKPNENDNNDIKRRVA
ncbi:MAG: hypothetical protein V8Q75_03930 [Bacilli bacterium]